MRLDEHVPLRIAAFVVLWLTGFWVTVFTAEWKQWIVYVAGTLAIGPVTGFFTARELRLRGTTDPPDGSA